MRSIKVIGKGRLRLRPDAARITLTLGGVCPEYGEALRRGAEEAGALSELLARFGFAKTDLKTLAFNVESEYEGYSEDGVYRQRFAGYRFSRVLKVEFPSDNALLGSVLFALSESPLKPELRLSYTVSDPEKAKNTLLAGAVKDAGEKARVLAEAAEVRLGEIQTIDYAWNENDFEVRPEMSMLAAGAAPKAAFDLDVTPEDIDVSDEVTVVWEIL
ncbi:MAG: SIMPL domain-containing protein [Oscillospiraceae bacterium]|nr:SIMPL domain-containing protein [Oscillospiraceae bacterium]